MNENNNLDPDNLNWIHEIQAQASALREASEALDEDVNCNSPFDIQDARG